MADLQGVIDLHVHAGPDVQPRKLDAVALARAARAAGMRALLLKSHHTITADVATITEVVVGGIQGGSHHPGRAASESETAGARSHRVTGVVWCDIKQSAVSDRPTDRFIRLKADR